MAQSMYFNTSHVSINLSYVKHSNSELVNFNTSHVSINPFVRILFDLLDHHFNTSHVSINPQAGRKDCVRSSFQYISCFY